MCRGRSIEGTKVVGGWTTATRCSYRVRRCALLTSPSSPTSPVCTAHSRALLLGHLRLCQCSHQPPCMHACSQAHTSSSMPSTACSGTSRRSPARHSLRRVLRHGHHACEWISVKKVESMWPRLCACAYPVYMFEVLYTSFIVMARSSNVRFGRTTISCECADCVSTSKIDVDRRVYRVYRDSHRV